MTEDEFDRMFLEDVEANPNNGAACMGLFVIVGLAWLVIGLAWVIFT